MTFVLTADGRSALPEQVESKEEWLAIQNGVGMKRGNRHFNPAEPRDRLGRWTETPGSGVVTPPPRKTSWPLDFESFYDLFDGFEHNGLKTVIRRSEEYPPSGGSVTFDVQEVGGGHVGYGQYHFQGDRAHIDRLFLSGDVQDRGFATALHQDFFKLCRERKIERVDLQAVSVGSYAWARAGFKWRYNAGAEQKRMYTDANDRHAFSAAYYNHVPQELFDELDRKIKAGEFESEAELAAFGRDYTWTDKKGHTMWLGKAVMLGGTWDGERAP